MEKLLTVKQLAQLLGYSERQMRRFIARADEIGLPYIRLEGGKRSKILFRVKAIEEWLKLKEVKFKK